jgi:hypothetical protein
MSEAQTKNSHARSDLADFACPSCALPAGVQEAVCPDESHAVGYLPWYLNLTTTRRRPLSMLQSSPLEGWGLS